MKEHIAELRTLERNLYAYNYALGLMTYDEATAAPSESAEGRAEAAEVLSRAQFNTLVQPSTDALLDAAEAEADTEQEKAEVRELRISLTYLLVTLLFLARPPRSHPTGTLTRCCWTSLSAA